MECVNMILSIISIVVTLVGIIITIIGVVIPITNERKNKLPKLILNHFYSGLEPSDEEDNKNDCILKGYFQINKIFDKELNSFLMKQEDNINIIDKDNMETIVEIFDSKSYNKQTDVYPNDILNLIVRRYKNNLEFKNMIKRYKSYRRQSRWELTIINKGDTDAINLTIDLFSENRGSAIYRDGTLKPDEEKRISLYYLDKAALVDKRNNNIYHDCSKTMIFYLVDKKKYNRKDERLFLITYKDIYGKIHKMYCCARIGKNDFYNPVGA